MFLSAVFDGGVVALRSTAAGDTYPRFAAVTVAAKAERLGPDPPDLEGTLKRSDVEYVVFLTVSAGVFLGFEPAPQGDVIGVS
tara:strand:+ start:481 stop:729 length:249 start_codon:yes stop_codon:yes gene_type:complete